MKSLLLFLVGLLLGANLVYFWMAQRDGCPPAATAPVTPSTVATPERPPTAPSPVGPPNGPPGRLLIPVQGVGPAQLADTFNDPRGTDRVHEAVDILAPRGTPVVAVADGRLVKLFYSKAGGLTLYQFDSTSTYAYYYAHLDSYAPGLAEGQMLRRGQVIGRVGSTGNADPSAPHLHFAVFRLGPEKKWWQGTPVNPYPLMR